MGATTLEPRKDPTDTAQADFSIHGMHCASCVGQVEKVLRGTSGVLEANINLAAERARVRYQSATASPETSACSGGASGASRSTSTSGWWASATPSSRPGCRASESIRGSS